MAPEFRFADPFISSAQTWNCSLLLLAKQTFHEFSEFSHVSEVELGRYANIFEFFFLREIKRERFFSRFELHQTRWTSPWNKVREQQKENKNNNNNKKRRKCYLRLIRNIHKIYYRFRWRKYRYIIACSILHLLRWSHFIVLFIHILTAREYYNSVHSPSGKLMKHKYDTAQMEAK